jgi:hypothetical protein
VPYRISRALTGPTPETALGAIYFITFPAPNEDSLLHRFTGPFALESSADPCKSMRVSLPEATYYPAIHLSITVEPYDPCSGNAAHPNSIDGRSAEASGRVGWDAVQGLKVTLGG